MIVSLRIVHSSTVPISTIGVMVSPNRSPLIPKMSRSMFCVCAMGSSPYGLKTISRVTSASVVNIGLGGCPGKTGGKSSTGSPVTSMVASRKYPCDGGAEFQKLAMSSNEISSEVSPWTRFVPKRPENSSPPQPSMR